MTPVAAVFRKRRAREDEFRRLSHGIRSGMDIVRRGRSGLNGWIEAPTPVSRDTI